MGKPSSILESRRSAEIIWLAAVAAVHPGPLIRAAIAEPEVARLLESAPRILIVGAGKASAAMAEGIEAAIPHLLNRIQGWINVPADSMRELKAIHLHAARPAGHNHPTAEGVAGAEEILKLVASATGNDVVLCLISGGGSALLPAPATGISLADKQRITELLHACGATISEMNAVRKHLSRIKGGRLAEAFHGKALLNFIISDVVGDPLDVIASGPTVTDPTTFADALAVLDRHGLIALAPAAVLTHLRAGAEGKFPETPKTLPKTIVNRILANNSLALVAATREAKRLGFDVTNLGSSIEGETRVVAKQIATTVREILRNRNATDPPVCLLSGGETTVTLCQNHGMGGRNQEFVLAMALELGKEHLRDVVILSGGTDGEDGPTDAAGAFADASTLERAAALHLNPAEFLNHNDAYHFFEATGDLFKPGLTETNVMDVRVILVC